MTITLSMIVKDETQHLPNCLKSVRNFVDEIVIIDTGSSDDTVDIAHAFGARVDSFDWIRDFSAARNYALSKVKTPWTLTLDADDVVKNPEILPFLASRAHQERVGGVWSVYIQDVQSQQRRLSLFRTKQYRWAGAVHESPVCRPHQDDTTVFSDLTIIHRKPAERSPLAARQYLDILLEKDTDNWLGLAESYKYLALHPGDGDNVEHLLAAAESNYHQAWSWEQSNPDTKYLCLLNLAEVNIRLSFFQAERLLLAKRYAQAAIGSRPERAEGYVYFADVCLREAEPHKAIKACEQALSLEIPKTCVGIVLPQHYKETPAMLLRAAQAMAEEMRIQAAGEEVAKVKSAIWTP